MDEIFATYKALEPMPEFKESKKETNNESQNTDVFNLKLFEKTQSLIDGFYKTDKIPSTKKEVKTETNIVENNPSTKKDFTINYNGNNNIKTIFSFLTQKGLTKEQAAGITGNIIAESGGNPKAYNKGEKAKGYKGYGRGIVQWSNERVNKFEEYMGIPILEATLWQQLEYMWHEMEERPAFMEALLNSETIEESTDAMLRGYENGSKNSLISIEKFNSIYKNNHLNGHSYEDSLANRIKKSLNVINSINNNPIKKHYFGGNLSPLEIYDPELGYDPKLGNNVEKERLFKDKYTIKNKYKPKDAKNLLGKHLKVDWNNMDWLQNYFETKMGYNTSIALLANILQESGGIPDRRQSNNGAGYGLLQWSTDDRKNNLKNYKTDIPKGINPELYKQASYIVATTYNDPKDSFSWHHGGTGSGYNSSGDARTAFISAKSDLERKVHALTYGYVRPGDVHNRANERWQLAQILAQAYPKTPSKKDGGRLDAFKKYQQGGKFWNTILNGIKTMSDPQTMGTSYMNSPAADPVQAQEAGKRAFDATTAGDVYNLSNAIHNKDKSGITSYALALALPVGLDGIVKGTKAIKNLSKVFNTNALDLSKVDYEIYNRSKTKGYNNEAIKISIKDNPNLGYFELVKDNEPGFYSVHFKTGNADTGKTFGSTPEQRQLLYEQIRNVLPEGAKVSTWGNVSEGGIKALNKVGKGYTNVGTRKVSDRNGNELNIPIFQKNTIPTSISTRDQLIPKNQAPEILQSILPKRNEYGLYSSKDLKKINEAKMIERNEILYGKTPLNYFYKEGVDFIRRNPTEEELLNIKERNLPRIDQMRPGRTDAEIKEGHDYIIDQLKKVNVVEYSENMMEDHNKITKGSKARAFSLSHHPAIAITKDSPTTKIDAIHELRHQMQNMFTRTNVEQDLFKKAFGDFKYRDGYDIDVEYETMTTDARNSLLDWCKKEWGDFYADGVPINYSDVTQQNHLINSVSDQDFIKILYNSDVYWTNYLDQIGAKYGYIPLDKIKDFKEVIFRTGMFITPVAIGATQVNKNKKQ